MTLLRVPTSVGFFREPNTRLKSVLRNTGSQHEAAAHLRISVSRACVVVRNLGECAEDVGQVRVSVAGLPSGSYRLNVYRVGYRVNDVYGDYLRLGAPSTLLRTQVLGLAERNDGQPIDTARIRITRGRDFVRYVWLRENDVYLITLESSQPVQTQSYG